MNKKFKNCNKFWTPVVNKLKTKLECLLNSFKKKEEKVWLTKKGLKILKEH